MPGNKLDDRACRHIIRDMGASLGVSAKTIVTKLMSEDDKNDMRNGTLSINCLECHIKAWIKSGMPDYMAVKNIPLDK